ncbi:hypothetical protein B7R22_00570 [Subtercola boreus]|uniref:FHA domain-containing protein n=1 Tax=Subtercola boreus TaxID=120213 RepID=A0A3E0W6V0_9MICO|nr:FHA domain-containing protein [Subtercola boreus]RFA17399.1 hypothetical protein B7R22_00570 [Subtercola boreus]
MPRQTYLPGTWLAVVSDHGVAMLPGDLPADLADTVWAALDGGHGLGAVLESLTGAFGTSLAAIPPFAVAIFSGAEVRLAVRGTLAISVAEPGAAPLTVSGRDITTWSERVVTGAETLLLGAARAIPDVRPEVSRGGLVIRSGVVLAESVRVQLVPPPGGASAPAAAPEAFATPPPSAPSGPPTTPDPATTTTTLSSPSETVEPVEPIQPTTVEEVHEPLPDAIEDTRTDIPDEAYDHLWGATVVKSIESAAVREIDDEDETEAPESQPSAPAAPVAPPAPIVPAPTPPAPADWTAPPATGLIDRVPGFSPAIGAPAPASAIEAETETETDRDTAIDVDVDHDGLTVTVSELDAMRRLGGATSGTDDAAATDDPDTAASASADHPSHGSIHLSTGDTVTLDRTIIIGRRPRANRVDADRMPTLVTVPSPQQDISRNHLEVRIEGRHVLAVDLETTNGSVLHREGTPPARLTPREPMLLLEGDVIDIGDGVTLTVEGLS